jgi:uncharacterized protein YjgD (DUF1641 family)
MSKNGTVGTWQDTPVGQQIQNHLAEERTLIAIDKLLTRLDTIEQAVDNLATMMQQGPGMVAMLADTADEMYRTADAQGVNVEERLQNALLLAEKLTAPAMVEKLDGLLSLSDQLPGLVAMTMDTVDEGMRNAIANGIDPQALANWAGQAGQALCEAQAEPPAKVGGIFGLLRALNDKDRQKALGFLMNFLKHLGSKL